MSKYGTVIKVESPRSNKNNNIYGQIDEHHVPSTDNPMNNSNGAVTPREVIGVAYEPENYTRNEQYYYRTNNQYYIDHPPYPMYGGMCFPLFFLGSLFLFEGFLFF